MDHQEFVVLDSNAHFRSESQLQDQSSGFYVQGWCFAALFVAAKNLETVGISIFREAVERIVIVLRLWNIMHLCLNLCLLTWRESLCCIVKGEGQAAQ